MLELLGGVGLAAPAVDLRPAGDAGLDPVAGEIAVDDVVIEPVGGLGLERVRARADQREVALEDDVEELRQLVEAGLADEAADAGDARIALGDQLGGVDVGLVDIHRAELVDLDQLVVEAVALLLEEHRPLAVELDGQRRERHHRRGKQEDESADDVVDHPLGHDVPAGNGLVEDVEEGDLADEGIGARPEAQLVGVRRQADVDRQHPELAHHLQHAVLGRDGQRHDEQVDARDAAEIDQFGDIAELRVAGDDRRRTGVLAVVEDAADADVVVGLGLDGADQLLGRFTAADDDGAAFEPARVDPVPHQAGEGQAEGSEDEEARDVPGGHPDAREGAADLAEEGDHGEEDEDGRPGEEDAAELKTATAEGRDRIAVGKLDHDDGEQRTADERRHVPPGEALIGPDIGEIDDAADDKDRGEFDEAGKAGEQDRRDRARRQARSDQTRGGGERRIAADLRLFAFGLRQGIAVRRRCRGPARAGVRIGRHFRLVHCTSVHSIRRSPAEILTGSRLTNACSDG